MATRREFMRKASVAAIAAVTPIAVLADDAALLGRKEELMAARRGLEAAVDVQGVADERYFALRPMAPERPTSGWWHDITIDGVALPKGSPQEWADYEAAKAAYEHADEQARRDAGAEAAELASDEANAVLSEIVDEILQTPAHTFEGLRFKISLSAIAGDAPVLSAISADLGRIAIEGRAS